MFSFCSAINISQGRELSKLGELKELLKLNLLDMHSDDVHNRSVVTIAFDSPDPIYQLCAFAYQNFTIDNHIGVHPYLGTVDVVPLVPLPISPNTELGLTTKLRDSVAREIAELFNIPVFLYGPERSLPVVRKGAFKELRPDFGPQLPDPHHGSCCVGARSALIAFNLYLKNLSMERAQIIAREMRSSVLRALAFNYKDQVQLSFNLVDPFKYDPLALYKEVSRRAEVDRCEIVGLIPEAVLANIPVKYWDVLDLAPEKTIEKRIEIIMRLRDE